VGIENEQQRRANQFLRQFRRGRENLDKLTDAGVRDVERLVREFREEIKDRLRSILPSDPKAPFLIRQLPAIANEIDSAVQELAQRANARINENLASAFDAGGKVSFDSIKAAGVAVAVPSISPEILATLSSVKDNVILGLAERMGDRINSQIRQTAVGLQPASQAIRNIERLLRTSDQVRPGLRRRIGFGIQAETIVRTETMRVFSNAQQSASEQIATTIPDLRKRWLTSPRNTRRGHKEAEDRYAPGGQIGPIKISETFRVSEFSRIGNTKFITVTKGGSRVIMLDTRQPRRGGRIITDRMLFPRDPGASPANVINCTCTVIDVLPDLEDATDRAKGIISA